MITGTPCADGDDTTVNDQGLVNCHAYPVLGFHTLSRNGQRLLKLRNPWSIERYYGPWSDLHDNAEYTLTEADKEELDHTAAMDGVFWMAIEDYVAYTSYTSMNYDVYEHGWHHAWHLTVDDDRVGGIDGLWSWCGSTCTRYTGVVRNTSDVWNRIHTGIHTWRWRSYAETTKCDQSPGKPHAMKQENSNQAYGFRDGERWLPIIELGPGVEQEYIIELDLNKAGMTKDWALTAWGENGPLEVFVKDKPSANQWPWVDRDDSLLPADEFEVNDMATNNDIANGHATTAEENAVLASNHLADIITAKSAVQQLKDSIDGHTTDAEAYRERAQNKAEDAANTLRAAEDDTGDIAALRAHETTASGKAGEANTASINALGSYDAADTINENDLPTAMENLKGLVT